MKISCMKGKLMQGISNVSKAVSTKTTHPILSCIFIEAENGNIKLTANDMEIGIESYVEGTVIEEGKVAIEAKLLSDIVRKLPDSEIHMETNEDFKTTIKCEKSLFTIAGKSGEDFSSLPVVEKSKYITISQFTLREIINQTIFSISDSEYNNVMTGELFEVSNNRLRVVAIDGHRIAIRNVELKDESQDVKVIVPGKALSYISKIVNGGVDDDVNIYFADNNILFEFDRTKVVSRLVEGEFFRIDNMLNVDYQIKFTINKREFLDCLDRSSLLIKESDKKPIKLTIGKVSCFQNFLQILPADLFICVFSNRMSRFYDIHECHMKPTPYFLLSRTNNDPAFFVTLIAYIEISREKSTHFFIT